jgi:hypothetical protein
MVFVRQWMKNYKVYLPLSWTLGAGLASQARKAGTLAHSSFDSRVS